MGRRGRLVSAVPLFPDESARPLARHTDPTTSISAPTTEGRKWAQQRILRVLEERGPMTVDRIFDVLRDAGYMGPESTVEGLVARMLNPQDATVVPLLAVTGTGLSRYGRPQRIVGLNR